MKYKNYVKSIKLIQKFIGLSCGVCALMLVGCATTPPTNIMDNSNYKTWIERQHELQNMQNWVAKGSFSVTYKNKTDMASFIWQEEYTGGIIEISGPMGLGNAKIIIQSDKAVLQKSSGEVFEADNLSDLVNQHLGYDLPIANLHYWLRGLPLPHRTAKSKYDDLNCIHIMQQDKWQVVYDEYGKFSNMYLPTRMYISNSQLNAKIVVKKWQLLS